LHGFFPKPIRVDIFVYGWARPRDDVDLFARQSFLKFCPFASLISIAS
jgi:hypothetical protein